MSQRIKSSGKPVGHYIAEWREHRGLSQEQLAERLGTTKASISRIENGKQPYSQPFLEACAFALMTDPGSLLMRNPLDKEAVWSLWDQAKPGQRKQIIQAAEKVLKKVSGG